MGAEDFQAILLSDNVQYDKVVETLRCIPNVDIDNESKRLADENYFVIDDGIHIIELEVSSRGKRKGYIKISCRFALCLPRSIDAVFYRLLRKIGKKFEMLIEVLDEVPVGCLDKFNPPDYVGMDHVLKKAIGLKRMYWVQDFGPETASLRTSEALKKFVTNQFS